MVISEISSPVGLSVDCGVDDSLCRNVAESHEPLEALIWEMQGWSGRESRKGGGGMHEISEKSCSKIYSQLIANSRPLPPAVGEFLGGRE